MIAFLCDTCGKLKKSEDWILGMAAESRGVVSERREINILSAWADPQAIHPLAVHFCSARCKERYMSKLFNHSAA